MYCIFILFLSLIVCEVNLQSVERIILDYFKSESVRKFRKEWDNHRKPLENAISSALKENVGFHGMNIYVRKQNDRLATGYYHNDNQVRLILKDLQLKDLPHCWLPEVQFSLASNVLKMQTSLSKMIIHAEYALIRNKSDIIYEPKNQNPYESSPFLFQQVQDFGKIAITMEGCLWSGFILTTLTGESVNMGYNHFRIKNCQYTIEIYQPGDDSPPVIAKYVPYREDTGLSLAHLLLKPLTNEELVPKLQAAMFSFVNSSAIFGSDLRDVRENQEVVFQATSEYLREVVRNLNRITIQKNHGAIDMANYTIHWDDGRVKANKSTHKRVGEQIKLMNMVLTGLDTAYSAHIGGPYKLNTVIIGEEIRFSILQVRGYLEVNSTWSDIFAFAAEITDMAVDIQLDVNLGNIDEQLSNKKCNNIKNIEVTGYRRMTFTVPTVIFGSADSMVGGYLLNELPRLIKAHLEATLPEALEPPKKKAPPVNDEKADNEKAKSITDKNEEINESEELKSSEDQSEANEEESSLENHHTQLKTRNVFKKSKKRFKSINRLLRSRNLGKLKENNQIRKK